MSYYPTCLQGVMRGGKAKLCGKRTAAHTLQGWSLCREHAKDRDDVIWCSKRKQREALRKPA